MRYRRFVTIFILILTLFVGVNYLVWKCWTEVLLTNSRFQGGDLARMGYVPGSKYYRKNITDLPRQHCNIREYDGRTIDMLTIGDSFSNGGAGGKNRFYQDYIASINGFEVLNIPRYRELDPISTVVVFNNNGLLNRIKPRYLLIGLDEKGAFEMSAPMNATLFIDNNMLKTYRMIDENIQLPDVSFINNGNVKFLINTIAYSISDRAPFGTVLRGSLDRNMFSVPDADRLLYLRDRRPSTIEELRGLNNNLNSLADVLALKGTELIFMPCVDKYNLYSDYIKNSRYPRSIFFEEMRKLPKRYRFIDTRAILAEELRKGEQDIFYADDTHWSWKASKKIFETVMFQK
ncbi:MAG: hypothetical protein WCP20_08105 [Desulfuromonadales bacterium]